MLAFKKNHLTGLLPFRTLKPSIKLKFTLSCAPLTQIDMQPVAQRERNIIIIFYLPITVTLGSLTMPLGNAGRIAICWAVLTVGGVYAFVLSKKSVENRRFDTLRIRERMKKANHGDYDHTISDRRFD